MSTHSTTIPLTDFISEFGDVLIDSLNESNPPVYTGMTHPIHLQRQQVMDGLLRKPFDAQAEVVQAVSALLIDKNESAAVINAEMGTGKTMMAIAAAVNGHLN